MKLKAAYAPVENDLGAALFRKAPVPEATLARLQELADAGLYRRQSSRDWGPCLMIGDPFDPRADGLACCYRIAEEE